MKLRIGAVIAAHEITSDSLKLLKDRGFQDINVFFWETLDGMDIDQLADTIADSGMPVSCISIFGNPLMDSPKGQEISSIWKTLAASAPRFGNPFISGFAGRPTGKSVPDSIPAWKAFFSDILDISYGSGARGILFENCRMGDSWKKGNWNIAINPDAWELMFQAIDDPKIGLQWEPCHQIEAFADPLPQLSTWKKRIMHLHGKDGIIDSALLASKGLYGSQKPFRATLPGSGASDWGKIISIVSQDNCCDSIDLEFQGMPFIPNIAEAERSLSYLQSLLH
ncbi:MAG: sugar phosphate isomerase/epimerase [Sphaerochaetaceae bacterium]|nr:sugar phosphate isomerase/epimerase [Sphaerochaetaceae bacterium]